MIFDRSRTIGAVARSLSLTGLLFAGAALGATPAFAGWDSIAVDDDTATNAGDAGYGIGNGDTKAAAESEAMKTCKGEGNSNCKVEISYKDMCGAYASSKNHSGNGTGATKAIASKAAMSSCGEGSCKIVVTDCVGE